MPSKKVIGWFPLELILKCVLPTLATSLLLATRYPPHYHNDDFPYKYYNC